MFKPALPATQTELQSVPKILDKIETGQLRIPIFQRQFLWDKPKILKLFHSIYNGYPIGSILLLKTDNRALEANLESIAFPSTKVKYPTTFVIDGMQRLSTLYGTLIHPKGHQPGSVFAIAFDLKKDEFKHYKNNNLKPWCVPLFNLLSYDVLVAVQESLIKHQAHDLFIKYINLYNAVQQYQIPVVTIENRSLDEVAEIFMRINVQGKPLSKPDLARTLQWIEEHGDN